jgi:predicted SAM-dependent methyltransferase
MLDQRIKDVLSDVTRPVLWANATLHRLRFEPSATPIYLNVGCGPKKIAGFVNIDHNVLRQPDLWLDIRNKLPFPDGTVDAIYFCHVLEHIRHEDALALCREYFRALKPGHGIRIVTPDLRKAAEAFLRGDTAWFSDHPEKRTSVGGRFVNYMLCSGQHVDMYDATWMTELLEAAGFVRVKEVKPAETAIFPAEIFGHLQREREETEGPHKSLFMEAFKP